MTRRTIPWASIFRNLGEKYGWTFEDIGRMSMYRVLVAAGFWCPEDITYRKEN